MQPFFTRTVRVRSIVTLLISEICCWIHVFVILMYYGKNFPVAGDFLLITVMRFRFFFHSFTHEMMDIASGRSFVLN